MTKMVECLVFCLYLYYCFVGMMMGNQPGMPGLQQGMQNMSLNQGNMMGQPRPMMGQMGKQGIMFLDISRPNW